MTAEQDNIRAALGWALGRTSTADTTARAPELGADLAVQVAAFWQRAGEVGEALRWLQRGVDAVEQERPDLLTECLDAMAGIHAYTGNWATALTFKDREVEVLRGFAAPESLAKALGSRASLETMAGESDRARASLREAVDLARSTASDGLLWELLWSLARLEADAEQWGACTELCAGLLGLPYRPDRPGRLLDIVMVDATALCALDRASRQRT